MIILELVVLLLAIITVIQNKRINQLEETIHFILSNCEIEDDFEDG